MRLLSLLFALVILASSTTVEAQQWVETPSALDDLVIAYAPYQTFFVDAIAIRSAQQELRFFNGRHGFHPDGCLHHHNYDYLRSRWLRA